MTHSPIELFYWPTPNGWKISIMLEECGLPYTVRYVDILKGDQFDPGYLKLNPKAVVPTLVHDGNVIAESTVICEYADEVFDGQPLKPATALGRAKMRVFAAA